MIDIAIAQGRSKDKKGIQLCLEVYGSSYAIWHDYAKSYRSLFEEAI
jgi:hypothetical protein